MNKIVDYNPSKGMAFQGDVAIVPVPADLAKNISHKNEISPRDGRLILAEGEVTGHHHAITLDFPRSAAVDKLMADALANKIAVPTAKFYRDDALLNSLVSQKILTRTDLCIGFLVIEGDSFVLSHEEHDGIRIPPGCYYIGGQVESVAGEMRRVAD